MVNLKKCSCRDYTGGGGWLAAFRLVSEWRKKIRDSASTGGYRGTDKNPTGGDGYWMLFSSDNKINKVTERHFISQVQMALSKHVLQKLLDPPNVFFSLPLVVAESVWWITTTLLLHIVLLIFFMNIISKVHDEKNRNSLFCVLFAAWGICYPNYCISEHKTCFPISY